MCILLKLHYAKFDVFRSFRSKVIEEKPFGGWLEHPPPLAKKGLSLVILSHVVRISDLDKANV